LVEQVPQFHGYFYHFDVFDGIFDICSFRYISIILEVLSIFSHFGGFEVILLGSNGHFIQFGGFCQYLGNFEYFMGNSQFQGFSRYFDHLKVF
jgi:hypothetical protein